MKIEKMNENQIRCTLTREDLASRQLKVSELAYGTEKAKTLFRDMMQQANYQFGFEAEDIPLMIEAIPMGSDSIVLIITKVEDPDELDTRFSRFAPSVTEEDDDEEDYDEYYEGAQTPEEMLDLFRRIQEAGSPSANAEYTPGSTDGDKEAGRQRIFRFDSMHQLISAAGVVKEHFHGMSTLYKGEGSNPYLLVLTQEDDTPEQFDRISQTLSEYGDFVRFVGGTISYMDEHFEKLISDNALEKLGNL